MAHHTLLFPREECQTWIHFEFVSVSLDENDASLAGKTCRFTWNHIDWPAELNETVIRPMPT